MAEHPMNIAVEKAGANWKNYVFQSLLATLTIFIVILIFTLQQAVIIASLGATAFIVFAMPGYITARPRNVIGGHIVGLLSGSLFAFIGQSVMVHTAIIYSLAVGLSIFLMVILNTEHPPASGTALGVAIMGFSLHVAVMIILSAVILSLAHHALKPYLKDLT